MSLEQNSPRTNDRPETWNPDNTLQAETRVPAPEHRDDKDKKKGLGLKGKIGLALAGLGIAGTAGLVGKSMGGGEAAPAPEKGTATSAPVNPSETPVANETEAPQEFKGFGLSAAEFEGNPEALADAYVAQLNAFNIAGSTLEASNDEARNGSDEAFIAEFSAPIDADFIDSLFVENWAENTELSEYIAARVAIAHRARELRMLSYTAVEIDPSYEPYVRETIIDDGSVRATDTPELVVSYTWSERDNALESGMTNNIDGEDVNTLTGGNTFTWVKVGDQMKISGVSSYTG